MDSEHVASGGKVPTPVPEDSAVVVDARGSVMVWSAGATQLLGYEPEEIVGRHATDLLAADLPASARRHIAEGRQWATEVALRHREGVVSWCGCEEPRWWTRRAGGSGS